MMQYDRITLGRQAQELKFVRDTFEKVCRLTDVLRFFEQDDLLSGTLALKGGTAINLTIFDLPRLSVDIDLDFAENLSRNEMLEKRSIINERITKYMVASGYTLSPRSKNYHALDSYVYSYRSAGGQPDNLKIEINYMLRTHALPLARRTVNFPWFTEKLTVLSVHPIEIFGSKIVALLNRTAPRDLYDVYNMQRLELFDEVEEGLLRKCIMLYSAIGADSVPTGFSFDSIEQMQSYRIKTDLVPVLHRGEFFDLPVAKTQVTKYLTELLRPEKSELEFWGAFRNKEYKPELLFDDPEILARLKNHPMAIWKCRQNVSTNAVTHI